jgi:hypothetical protein
MDPANAAETGTTSMCPPRMAVLAAPPDWKTAVRSFRISTPVSLSAATSPR